MKVSVLIPAYNCATTIRATLDAVLRQSVPPDEILVMNDGSTDDTASVLESYKDKISVFWQSNKGLASARNELALRAHGDLIAYLDSDDIWHPKYLEMQKKLFEEHPTAVAFFTGHANFYGYGDYVWKTDPTDTKVDVELISALDFFKRYNKATGPFSCFSYCCVPLSTLRELGDEPFREMGTEDSYCFSLLVLLGRPFVFASADLVAYRIREESLSQNRAWTFGVWVHIFELLEATYKKSAGSELWKAFCLAFASRRRSYAKILMGAGKTTEARKQLRQSLGNSGNPVSVAKSLAMLGATGLPKALQPTWLPSHRVWNSAEEAAAPTVRTSGEKG
jgi:glycosyltransferase involved in cell wall biosynthesis